MGHDAISGLFRVSFIAFDFAKLVVTTTQIKYIYGKKIQIFVFLFSNFSGNNTSQHVVIITS